jgi:hypothetical protein
MLSKIGPIWDFCLKINHLATLIYSIYSVNTSLGLWATWPKMLSPKTTKMVQQQVCQMVHFHTKNPNLGK